MVPIAPTAMTTATIGTRAAESSMGRAARAAPAPSYPRRAPASRRLHPGGHGRHRDGDAVDRGVARDHVDERARREHVAVDPGVLASDRQAGPGPVVAPPV